MAFGATNHSWYKNMSRKQSPIKGPLKIAGNKVLDLSLIWSKCTSIEKIISVLIDVTYDRVLIKAKLRPTTTLRVKMQAPHSFQSDHCAAAVVFQINRNHYAVK